MFNEYLDKTGVAVIASSINKKANWPIIQDTRSSAAAAITATAPFATLEDGQRITLHIKKDMANSSTLNLTLSGGGTTGAKSMVSTHQSTSASTTWNTIKANSYIDLVYESANNRWVLIGQRDTNSTYSGMTQAEINAGSSTTDRLIAPSVLRSNFYTETEVDNLLAAKANTEDLATVATSGSYNDLSNKPTIPSAPGTLDTTATTTQSTSASESLSGTVKLHKVAKTGKYSDLVNTPVIPSAPGTLNTNNSTAQTVSSSEALSGTIKLHKIAKTGAYGDLIGAPTGLATESYVNTAIAGLIDSAPGTLDTLNELATALGNDPNFATTIATALGNKANTADLATVATSGSYNDLSNKPTIPSAPGTLVTNKTTAQTASSGEAMSGTINLHKVAKTGTYSDLIGTPSLATVATSGSYNDLSNKPTIPSAPGTLNTNNATAQTASSSEALSGTIKLHKVAKTGTYSDLIGTPTIPAAPGTLVTNKTTAQTASSGEAMSGTINLHKIAKTGTYSDLIGTPTIPSAPGTLNTNNTTAQTVPTSAEALSGAINLHKVSKTGSYNDLLNKPTIPTVNNATLTIQKEGTTVKTFTANASSNVTCNIVETDPIFGASAAAGITSTNITSWNNAKNTAKLNQISSSNMALPLIVAPSGTGDGSVSELNYVPGISYNPSNSMLNLTNPDGQITFGSGNNNPTISGTTYSGRALGTETLFASTDDELQDGAAKIGFYDDNTETSTTVHEALIDLYDSIPAAPGTLNTNNTSAQTVSSSEALSGTIKLHKVSKTGSYNDLLNKPTIPTIPSLSKGTTSGSGNAVTDISVSDHTITLTKGTTFISTAGSGLTKTGNSLGHSNSVVSPTTEEFRTFKYDAQGHISTATAADEIDFTSFNVVTLSADFLSRCAYNYDNPETSMGESAVDMNHSSSLVPYKTIPYRTITPSTGQQGEIKK